MIYVVVDKARKLVEEPNAFVTLDAAFLRSTREPVTWEEAARLQRERRERLFPTGPTVCMCCGQEVS